MKLNACFGLPKLMDAQLRRGMFEQNTKWQSQPALALDDGTVNSKLKNILFMALKTVTQRQGMKRKRGNCDDR